MTQGNPLRGALDGCRNVMSLAYEIGYIHRGDFERAIKAADDALALSPAPGGSSIPMGVTEEMVERALEIYWANLANVPRDDRRRMRAALEAALGEPK